MSFAYLPWYTGDYLRDTRGLSMAGHGCYLLLLAFCWDTRGPLPLDVEEIATVCGARSQEERATMERILGRYFERREDGYHNPRLEREIERSEAVSEKRSYAGRQGANERMRRFREAEANAQQMLSKSLASAKQVTEHPSPSLSPALTPSKSKAIPVRATRLPADWRLPDEWKAWAITVHHLEPDRAVRISLVFRDYWISLAGAKACKTDWQAVWRNWIRKETADA